MATKYYVLSGENVGPNAKPLNETVTIQTAPGKTNMYHEPKINGWLGTTNDYAEYAHGEFETLELAQEYISKKWPFFEEQENGDEEIVASYADRREVWDCADWLYEIVRNTIKKSTTDEEIKKLAIQWEIDAENEYIYLKGNVEEYLMSVRNELRK